MEGLTNERAVVVIAVKRCLGLSSFNASDVAWCRDAGLIRWREPKSGPQEAGWYLTEKGEELLPGIEVLLALGSEPEWSDLKEAPGGYFMTWKHYRLEMTAVWDGWAVELQSEHRTIIKMTVQSAPTAARLGDFMQELTSWANAVIADREGREHVGF